MLINQSICPKVYSTSLGSKWPRCKVHSTEDLAPTAMLIREINGVLALLGIRSMLEQPKCDCYHGHLYLGKALKWIKQKDEETHSYSNTTKTELYEAWKSLYIGWCPMPDLNACWPSLRKSNKWCSVASEKEGVPLYGNCLIYILLSFALVSQIFAWKLHLLLSVWSVTVSAEVPLSLW